MLKRRWYRLKANFLAARGKTKAERKRIREQVLSSYRGTLVIKPAVGTALQLNAAIQDLYFPPEVRNAERLIVMLVPEHNAMSGGIFSFFSIVNQMRRIRASHGYEVVIMTRPVWGRETYFRNTNFRNSENVFRFDQLLLCTRVKDLYIQLPEYAAGDFHDRLSDAERAYLTGRDFLAINVLNQNIMLMPERDALQNLKRLTENVSQSVAHHAYFSQEMADRYQLPSLLLPAYTDLSAYTPSSFKDKEKLIIYSLDDHPQKAQCLKALTDRFPGFELREIRGVTFDVYMDLATRCMFSITFGEGFDGYLAQPIQQGGVAFAIYNEDFFPSRHFVEYENIFDSGEQMVSEICDRMAVLMGDPSRYDGLSAQFQLEYKKLYSLEDYVCKIRKLCLRDFELMPAASSAS